MGVHDHFKERECLATKINVNFFVRDEVLNIFHVTIFFKKKKKKNSKIIEKNCFWGYDHFSWNGTLDDKNEYNLFYGKWGTKEGFEIFSSKNAILAD